MDVGNDSGDDIIGEIDGFGLGFFRHDTHFLGIPEQEPVRISPETLLSQAFLQISWPKPSPIQDSPQ